MLSGQWFVAGAQWLVFSGWCLVASGWWLVASGQWLVVGAECLASVSTSPPGHEVLVLDDGAEYRGAQFSSLTAVAKEITGAHWSGPRFFGLKARGKTDGS